MGWALYAVLGVVVAILLGAPLIASRLKELHLSQAGLGSASQLSDESMLAHLTRVLSALGYRVQRATSADPDVDLILVDGLGQKSGVFLRRWRSAIDDDTVRAVVDAGARVGKGQPLIVTTDRYTQKARDAARAAGVTLWALPELTHAIGKVRQSAVAFPDLPARPGLPTEIPVQPIRIQRPTPAPPAIRLEPISEEEQIERNRRALTVITGYDRAVRKKQRIERQQDEDPPDCPKCGKRMAARVGKKGEYWACTNFPRCSGSRPL